ncbi:MAG: MaoC family dehydratase [Dehalococcoidia bacterium]
MTTDTSSTSGDPTIGKVLDDRDFVVTDVMIDDHFDGLALDRAAFDRGEAPVPSMISGGADNFHGQSAFKQDRGHLWMRQEWDLLSPLVRGDEYVASARIEDIYKRRDRTVVNTAMELKDAGGQVVIRSKHHQSFLLDEPNPEVELRDPSKKEGARKFQVPDGTEVTPLDRVITLEMCGKYFHGSRSYHTDLEASKELGFQKVVVGGRLTMSYMGTLLEQHFGDAWWNGGRMDMKFTNPTWPDDHITVRGVATGPAEDDAAREAVFAWIEKDDGTIVAIADASAPR